MMHAMPTAPGERNTDWAQSTCLSDVVDSTRAGRSRRSRRSVLTGRSRRSSRSLRALEAIRSGGSRRALRAHGARVSRSGRSWRSRRPLHPVLAAQTCWAIPAGRSGGALLPWHSSLPPISHRALGASHALGSLGSLFSLLSLLSLRPLRAFLSLVAHEALGSGNAGRSHGTLRTHLSSEAPRAPHAGGSLLHLNVDLGGSIQGLVEALFLLLERHCLLEDLLELVLLRVRVEVPNPRHVADVGDVVLGPVDPFSHS
mmetsp:Transcript_18059/g.59317  ORF Transcript_18059/g.59317 Transcript_18059/m.59317 type:complete len:257 (-) Transcript_18059:219-989(-)